MKILSTIFTLLLFVSISSAQDENKSEEKHQDTLSIYKTFRVDFEEDSVRKEVYDTFKNYLNTREDQYEDNPYWNKEEQEKYGMYDFSASLIYNGGLGKLELQYVKDKIDILVLSIDKMKDGLYSISAEYQVKGSLKEKKDYLKLLCIQRVNAIKEDGKWKLQNYRPYYISDWKDYNTKHINYHYSKHYNFDKEKANQAENFYQELLDTYQLEPKNKTIDYYLASNSVEFGKLYGFDYFGISYTNGMTNTFDGVITSSTEIFHAHELVHFAFASKGIRRNFLIEEGLASFLGSRVYDKKSYEEDMNKLIHDIQHDSSYTLQNLIGQNDDEIPFNGYNYKYPFGALLCKIVFDKKGKSGLKQLMFSDTDKIEDLKKVLKDLLGLKNDEQLFESIRKAAKSIYNNEK